VATWIGLLVATFVAMEAVAYLLHRFVMHGPLWVLHESHHRPRSGRFERNDLFGVFFALPSMALIYAGTHGSPLALPIGIGMTAYGMAYWGFHDFLVHRRLRHSLAPKSSYLKRIVRAHLVHHRTHTKHGATSFGFLYSGAPDTRESR
jgi:beta-carotene 3-hydroxylase